MSEYADESGESGELYASEDEAPSTPGSADGAYADEGDGQEVEQQPPESQEEGTPQPQLPTSAAMLPRDIQLKLESGQYTEAQAWQAFGQRQRAIAARLHTRLDKITREQAVIATRAEARMAKLAIALGVEEAPAAGDEGLEATDPALARIEARLEEERKEREAAAARQRVAEETRAVESYVDSDIDAVAAQVPEYYDAQRFVVGRALDVARGMVAEQMPELSDEAVEQRAMQLVEQRAAALQIEAYRTRRSLGQYVLGMAAQMGWTPQQVAAAVAEQAAPPAAPPRRVDPRVARIKARMDAAGPSVATSGAPIAAEKTLEQALYELSDEEYDDWLSKHSPTAADRARNFQNLARQASRQ